MRIGVDIDGVLRDLYSKLVEVYGNVYKHEWCYSVKDWVSYDLEQNFSIGKEIHGFFFRSEHTEEIYSKAHPLPGIIVINKLAQFHDVELISTQPNILTEHLTLDWVHGQNINHSGIHFTRDKWRVDCDVYVEDNPIQITNLHGKGKKIAVIDWKYNRTKRIDEKINTKRYTDFIDFSNDILGKL